MKNVQRRFENQCDKKPSALLCGDDDNQVDSEHDGLDLNINISPISHQKLRKSSSLCMNTKLHIRSL